jgi:dTDP-4-dehydrorhamnose reductase
MERRIAIAGGGGFVGGNLGRLASLKGWDVHVLDSSLRPGLEEAEWYTVDLRAGDAVRSILTRIRPSLIVDVAAVADIDRAEREPMLARDINVEVARRLAEASKDLGARFIYFSSDAVFDGRQYGYTEIDPPAPVNWYGKTKAEGESAVLNSFPAAVVVRISLVLGFPVTGGNSFLAGLEARLKAGAEISCPPDEVRTPVDVHTLCECVLELGSLDFSGIIHIGATDSVSRLEIMRRAATLMGYPGAPFVIEGQEGKRGRAPRHKNGILRVTKARALLKTRLLGSVETIERAVTKRNERCGVPSQ